MYSAGQVWYNSMTPVVLTSVRWEIEATASHLAESVEGKKNPLNRTCNEGISDPFLKLKLFVCDSIHDVLQKEKGGKERKRKKKAKSNHKPSFQTSINSSVVRGKECYCWTLHSLEQTQGINCLAVRRWSGQVCRLTVWLTDFCSWGWAVGFIGRKNTFYRLLTRPPGCQFQDWNKNITRPLKYLHLSLWREEI